MIQMRTQLALKNGATAPTLQVILLSEEELTTLVRDRELKTDPTDPGEGFLIMVTDDQDEMARQITSVIQHTTESQGVPFEAWDAAGDILS